MKTKDEILEEIERSKERCNSYKGHMKSQEMGYLEALEWVLLPPVPKEG